MRTEALQHAQAQRQVYLNQLLDLLRIPSISTLSERKADLARTAEWVASDMRRIGLNRVEIFPTAGHPIVYGEWLGAGPEAHTVLVYGHYDVQPVDPLHLWESEPFEPTIRDGEIYARGASDDKGQMFLHLKAAESLLATGGSPVNVKFLIEGEEEIGSPNLDAFIEQHPELLACDSVLISDGRIISESLPSLVYALRGLTYMEIRVKGPRRDLHSGSFGGSVHNPAQLVAEICAALHDKDGHITIPGFYDKVRALSEAERAALAKVPYGQAEWSEETGLAHAWGEPDFSIAERVWARPTCEVNGIYGGFMEEGAKTVIPAQAGAKISMRLVADQDPFEIAELFKAYIRTFIPADYELIFLEHSHGWPAITPIDAPEMDAAARAYAATWGVDPVFAREGGSIPVVATCQRLLRASVVLMGFGLDDNIHSPNEHFRVDFFHRGIDTVIHYYHNLAGK